MSKTQAMVKDRISALPDTVLCHILSFLPTLCAVRTTILSRRWKNIWTSVSNLDFDDQRDLLIDPYDCYDTDRFPTFIDHVYFFRDSSDIQKLRLKLENGTPDYFARIDGWIRTAVRRNVVEVDLRLFFRWGARFQFPRSLFVCKTLAVLKVSSNAITYNPPTAGCFPSLKFLHVTVDDYDAYSMEKLFSYCPVLEHLTIDGRNLTDAYNFKVTAPELKTLIISLDECEEEQDFYINAPKLEDLDLKQVALSNYNFQNAKSLVNASIVFRALSPGEQASFPTCAIALLAVVSNVKFLSLSIHCLEARYLPPAFGHLNRLKLVLHDCNYWDFLGELLDRSPKLEDLVLETGTKCDEEYSVSQWNQPQYVPACLVGNLRTISIRGFRGRQVEMEVAKYLLKNGYVLNKMTIYADPLYTEEKELLYKEFLMFQRRSMTCQVEIIAQSRKKKKYVEVDSFCFDLDGNL